jgi:hypothetical protein
MVSMTMVASMLILAAEGKMMTSSFWDLTPSQFKMETQQSPQRKMKNNQMQIKALVSVIYHRAYT